MMTAPRVLLVDDEEDFLRLLTSRLRRRALDVSYATTGEAALAMLGSHPVDVVVLDIRLPGMDGLETLKRIRQHHPTTQVIMLTGFADTEMAQQATQIGAAAYLVKPVEVDLLLDRIRRAFDALPQSPESREP